MSYMEFLPLAGAGVGYAAGQFAEYRAVANIEGHSAALANVWQHAREAIAPSRAKQVGAKALAPLALVGGLAGFANTAAWIPEEGPELVPPTVAVVIDHSYATTLDEGKAHKQIDSVAEVFADTESVKAQAVIAGGGVFELAKITDVAKDEPFGAAPMPQAFNAALEQVTAANQQKAGKIGESTNAIVVATNGNGIGAPDEVISRANEAGIPVFVVNAEGKATNPAAGEEFKEIAKQTQGKVWTTDQKNLDEVVEDITKKLVPSTEKDPTTADWIERLVYAIGFTTLLPVLYRRRSQLTHRAMK